GMLRAAYAYCGLPAFVSLSMAGSESGTVLSSWVRVVYVAASGQFQLEWDAIPVRLLQNRQKIGLKASPAWTSIGLIL
ncbi:MAG: hypothetical protein M3H12_18890, partial [Chromatiales bacterium]